VGSWDDLKGEAGEAGALDGEPGQVAPLARPQAVALHLVQAEHRHRRYARQPTHDQAGTEYLQYRPDGAVETADDINVAVKIGGSSI
jgi:hypothetical protein